MDKLDLEKFKEDKIEYDKKIRSLDYKIVETSVEMYNARSYNFQFYQERDLAFDLKVKISEFEKEKVYLTKEFWNEIVSVKIGLEKLIKEELSKNSLKKDELLWLKLEINKITDVYFDINKLTNFSYLIKNCENREEKNDRMPICKNDDEDLEKKSKEQKVIQEENNSSAKEEIQVKVEKENTLIPISQNNKIATIEEPWASKILKVENIKQEETKNEELKENVEELQEEQPDKIIQQKFEQIQSVQQFDIKEQRVVDFVNLLNLINRISKTYRTDIEKALSRFIINYKIIKNTQYLQNDFDNLTNNFLDKFKNLIQKFEKDESIDALQLRVEEQRLEEQNIDKELLINNSQIEEIQRKMQELAKIYFVGGYVKKIQNQIIKFQSDFENNTIFNQNNENDEEVFKKIKEIAYDKRMNHIIEVSRWTKNVEEKLKIFYLEETDFQFVIYLIRQTENICNANYEQIANLIIRLCDINIKLENVEKNEKIKNKKLKNEKNITNTLIAGIEGIRKKYTKIPFIGRKVTSILSAKMLNE